MFARLFAVASLAALAVAGPARLASRDQCSTGSISCCNSVQKASDVSNLLGWLGLVDVLADVTGEVGLGCDPITVIGAGQGATCSQQTVCCTGNTFDGLINVGCTSISGA